MSVVEAARPAAAPAPEPSRLLPRDILAVGSIGLRTRKLRAALSAVGVAIGIASMVAVLGISASSQAELLDQIDALGTNLLTVEPGQSFIGGETSELPEAATARVGAINGVQGSAALYSVSGATVRRSALVDSSQTSGITVYASDLSLPETLSAEPSSGSFLTAATASVPTVVLGSVAARRLGISKAERQQVWIGDRYYAVIGVMSPVTLDGSLDRAAFIGLPEATRTWETDPTPAKIYLRTDEDQLTTIRDLVGGAANPENPEEVSVSRPSDALEAKAAAEGAFTSLLLGLGAVALLVGGVGIANVMVISVIERRSEIGLRRALGATRRHITTQFLTEALLLSAAGGLAGAALGAGVTALYSLTQGLAVVVPPEAVIGGVAA
ncbi:MAG: ABC transporter permease, partial [Solirubrobacteraceae bacterium]|nr:ABC transporter permease [Solirubrobacteraceae bacterium]